MIIEEKKAVEKVCCGPAVETDIKCAGSRCMAWRWADKGDRYFDPALQAWASKPDLSTTHGYCGLAGRPQ